MNRKSTLFFVWGLLLALSLASCNKIQGPQKVPSYIHIESIGVDSLTDYFTYGANTSKIADAWVYVDDQLIGAYELPTTFPVLKKGPHKVAIYGGIKVDGRSDTRDRYPFYRPLVYNNLNLAEDSIVNLTPALSYYPIGDGTNVAWMEEELGARLLPVDTREEWGITGSLAADWQRPCGAYVIRRRVEIRAVQFFLKVLLAQ